MILRDLMTEQVLTEEEIRKKSRSTVQKDRIRIKLKEISSKRRGAGEEEDEIDVVDVEPTPSQDEFATPKAYAWIV